VPRHTARAGGRPVDPPAIGFQLLWHRIAIEASDPDAREVLAYLAIAAEQQIEPRLEMRYRVHREADGYTVLEEGNHLGHEPGRFEVLDTVYRRVYQRALEYASLCGWVRLHAGLVELADGRRVLLLGPSGAGKTTLLLRLLFDGAAVQTDENVLVRAGRALAVPRPFRIDGAVDELLPELTLAPLLPTLPNGGGRLLDPGAVGRPWRIDAGGVDDVVLLDGHAAPSLLSRVEASSAMPAVVEQALPNQESPADVLREIAAIMRTARCWRLRTGPLPTAARLLSELSAA
jgi:hypothetical protein